MIILEKWKDIKGYEGLYQVSNFGNVKSLNYKRTNKEALLKLQTNTDGYKIINLRKDGKNKLYLVHRLVAMTFIPNPNNYPIVNHKDENKENNSVDNLEWCTHIYNLNYGDRGKVVSKVNKESNNNNIIPLDVSITYNTSRMDMNVNISIPRKAIQEGALKKIGARNFTVLCGLYSYMNSDYVSFPSIRTLSTELGMDTKTIQRAIEELCNDGYFIIEQHTTKGNPMPYNVYKFPSPNNPKEIIEEEEEQPKPKNSRDFVNYFCSKYNDTYGLKYVPNYRVDCSMFKAKIMKNYSEEEITEMLNILFESYALRWRKRGYEYPTLGAFCSWLHQECYKIYKAGSKKKEAQEAQQELNNKAEGLMDDLLNRL